MLENDSLAPIVLGKNAARAYAELGGSGDLPVEIEARKDANFLEWRQTMFGNELMMFVGPVGSFPLS